MRLLWVAGLVFAGCVPPAPAIDAGLLDAGAELADAGSCNLTLRADAGALAASPRGARALELLALHAEPSRFGVDEDTYARASSEWALLNAHDAGVVQFLPSWGLGLTLYFDRAGAAEVAAGTYRGWDCLNAAYRARPTTFPSLPGAVALQFDPVVALPQLAADYAALPNVTLAEQGQILVCQACGCGSDVCLQVDRASGEWTWLGYEETNTCQRAWYRLRTWPDGGSDFEARPSGPPPGEWLDAAPSCVDQL